MIIDAHLHIWDLKRALYPWLGPGMGSLYRSVAFDEIAPTLRELRVDGAVLVQASDEAGDTEVMLEAAATHPQIVGVVAWAPLDDPEALVQRLARFTRDALVVGIRNLVHERPREWLLGPEVGEGLAAVAAHHLPLDIPTSDHAALADVATIGRRHPTLRLVIDHLGKPPIGGTARDRSEWRALITECAANPLTVAKLSGLYSARGALDSWTLEAVRPFVDDALELFGPERLMYGGDWPISVLAGGYVRSWEAITGILAPRDLTERQAIFGGTAELVYALDDARVSQAKLKASL